MGRWYGQIDHVDMDDGRDFLSTYARTLSSGELRFHTDRTDVVGLLCIEPAARSGVSRICSSVTVMNEMLERRPDLARVLFEPVNRSRLGEESDVADDVYPLPIFGLRDGRFTSHFSLTCIEAASRPLPEDHAVLWRSVDAGAVRGGIGQSPSDGIN